MKEKIVTEAWENYLGPVAMAQFIEAGWIREWPKMWSKAGLNAVDNGFGQWGGSKQRLLYPAKDSERGAAWWPGRRA
jgi:hypothetical protein